MIENGKMIITKKGEGTYKRMLEMQRCSVCDPMKPVITIAPTQVVVKSWIGGDGWKRKYLNKKCRWRRPVQKVDFIGKRDWSAALCEKSEGCATIVVRDWQSEPEHRRCYK